MLCEFCRKRPAKYRVCFSGTGKGGSRFDFAVVDVCYDCKIKAEIYPDEDEIVHCVDRIVERNS